MWHSFAVRERISKNAISTQLFGPSGMIMFDNLITCGWSRFREKREFECCKNKIRGQLFIYQGHIINILGRARALVHFALKIDIMRDIYRPNVSLMRVL